MDILILQVLNSLLYASALFLLAAWIIGKSSAIVSGAWLLLVLPVAALAVAGLGMLIELVLLRRFYPRSEEYQLLFTFGLLLILEDSMLLIWGPYPMSADALIDAFGILDIAGARYPAYNLIVIGAGVLSAVGLWLLVSRTKFGLLL